MTVINCKKLRFYNGFTVVFTVAGGQIGCPYFTVLFFYYLFIFILFIYLFFYSVVLPVSGLHKDATISGAPFTNTSIGWNSLPESFNELGFT